MIQKLTRGSNDGYCGPATVIAEFECPKISSSPKPRQILNYADALRLVGRFNDALTVLHRLESEMEIVNWRVYLFRGQTLRDAGRFSEAEMCFRQTLAMIPESTIPYVFLAEVLTAQEAFSEALGVLSIGVEKEGDSDEIYLNIAINHRALGNLSEAQRNLELSLVLNPEYEEAKALLHDIMSAIVLRDANTH
jgi:tetratricopeptide (TPR) repeat protein